MDFDQVLQEIGEFGRYQKTNYLLICLPVMFAAANSLSYVFTAGKPNYRCHIPECDNTINPNLHESWLPNAAPGTYDKHGYFVPEICTRYAPNNTQAPDRLEGICPQELFNKNIKQRCHSWIYDPLDRTIVQEWELTCKENDWKLAFVGTTHFAGLVVGTALSGYFADRFGRKVIFIVCIIFMAITGIAQGLAWTYESFLVFAFLNAVGTSGVYPLAFILGVEMVGASMREMSSNVLNYFYAVGEALVGLIAWMVHDWKSIQYVLSAPPLIFIVYYWMVPESVRWLLARNEREKACLIVKRAARVNKKELSTTLLNNFSSPPYPGRLSNDAKSFDPKHEIQIKHPSDGKSDILTAIIQIFRSKRLMIRYSTTMFIWVVNAIVFYGLSLNSTNLSGNKYLNFILVCLIEIPGYTLAWISLKKFGRRYALASSMFLCAITCATGGFVNGGADWVLVALFLIGKLGITSSFSVIYTYTAEIMPTVIRSGGVGVMSTSARFGAMLAPFVPLLSVYYEPLPLLFFGGLSLAATFLAFLLPETFRKKLPDTVAEAKSLSKNTHKISPPTTDDEEQDITGI